MFAQRIGQSLVVRLVSLPAYREEKRLAESSRQGIEHSKRFSSPIVTQVVAATEFYQAEEYHQDFYKKNPIRYKYYKFTCGRAQRLASLWGDK